MRKRYIVLLAIVCAVSLLYGCGRAKAPGPVLAKVNDYRMTVDDFRMEIEHSSYMAEQERDIDDLLDLAIRKQVLIQEAQRRGLDKEKSFMQTIERYWEQTLIRELLNTQMAEIEKTVSKENRQAALALWIDELYRGSDIAIDKDVLKRVKDETAR
jgi:hypothetical protein